jgi:predicted RNase H-like nuclease
MLNGADLHANLETTHALFDHKSKSSSHQICFEMFPQAIACALAGQIVSAKQKRRVRRGLLDRAKIDTSKLANIDEIDAALCAFTAHLFAQNNYKCYDDADTGFIVVPGESLKVEFGA